MSKNTGDGELDEIVQQIEIDSMIAFTKSRSDGDPKHHQEMIAKSKAAIKKYAAQEASKAQQQLLQGLMEEFQEARTWEDKSQRHASGIFLDNDDQVIGYNEAISHGKSVIQNKLEGLQ